MVRITLTSTVLLLYATIFSLISATPIVESNHLVLSPRADATPAPLTEDQKWLANIKTFGAADKPPCTVYDAAPQNCSFVFRAYADQSRAEWWIFNNKCETLQYYWMGEAYPVIDYPMGSALPKKLLVSQARADTVALVKYGDKRADLNSCYNGGPSLAPPGFRLTCKIEFNCSGT